MMGRTKAVIGALVVCVVGLMALGVGSASAAGMTGVECKEVAPGTGHFETNRCETPEGPGGNFETVAAPVNELVQAEGEAVGAVLLAGKLLTIELEIMCEVMHATGEGKNIEEGGEMRAHGTSIVHHYESCGAYLKGRTTAEEKCNIENLIGNTNQNTLLTNPLTAITLPEHKVEVKPETVTQFAKFKILTSGLNCHLPATTVEVTGSVIGIANTTKHSHLTFEAATNGSNLRAFGNVAHVTGTTTGWKKGESGRAFGGTTF